MASYKKIIENMVEANVEKIVEQKAGKGFAYLVEGTLKLSPKDKNFDCPTFDVEVEYEHRNYSIHGYISDWGIVHVTIVSFDRDCMKDPDRDDWYAKDNIEHRHEFLFGDQLADFHFDR